MPLVPVLADVERAGIRIDGPALAAQSQHIEQALAQLHRADLRAGRRSSSTSTRRSSSAKSCSRSCSCPSLKKTGRTRSASTAVEVLEELALTHELPRLVLEWRALQQVEEHVYRRAAADGPPGNRPRAHLLQPGGCRDGALEQLRSEPAEHPDPHRARPRDPARLHRRTRARPDLGRLLADRAARARPHGRRARR